MHALSGVTSTINMAAVAMMEAAILSLAFSCREGDGVPVQQFNQCDFFHYLNFHNLIKIKIKKFREILSV